MHPALNEKAPGQDVQVTGAAGLQPGSMAGMPANTDNEAIAALVGQQVTVHLNLTTKQWVIATKPKGKKIGAVTTVTLKDVTFKVSEAQRQYCINHNGRWVHAWAIGTLVSYDDEPDTSGEQITYNPFRAPTFHVAATGEPVHHAPLLHFVAQHAYTA